MCPSLSKEKEEREEEEGVERASSNSDQRDLSAISDSSGPYNEHISLRVESLYHFTWELCCLNWKICTIAPAQSISLGSKCNCAL